MKRIIPIMLLVSSLAYAESASVEIEDANGVQLIINKIETPSMDVEISPTPPIIDMNAPNYLEMVYYRMIIALHDRAIREGRAPDYYVNIFKKQWEVEQVQKNSDALRVVKSFEPGCPNGFEIWGEGTGICNQFVNHQIAEQHYLAAQTTVNEFLPKLDSCLNELSQIKNDQGQEPILPPTSGVKGCDEILKVEDGGKFIYKQSAPIRASAAGSPITGFRQEPTLIMNVDISSKGRIPILDSNGDQIVSCPWASATGHKGGRARCTAKTSDVRRKAIANTGSASILFKVNASQCVLVPDAGRCVGSTKGQCDRLID